MKILLILVILFEGLAFSGPNQNAVLSVDLLPGTAVPDSAHSLIGSDSVQSPSGAGIVALIRFQPRGKAGVAVFTLGLPQLLDWKLQLDTAIVVQGAKLTLTSVVGINSRYESNRPGALATTFLSLAGTRDLLGRIPYSRRTPEEIVFPF
jgi:hypothetical protein